MPGLMVFVSAFAALSAAAAAGVTEQGLRGERSLQATLYCNSIGCPNGFTPIDDAQNVACDSDPCEVDQCCNLFCNSIGCPNGFIPIIDAQTTLCDADPCDPAQCCDLFCFSHPCSNGLIPIEDSQTTLCPDSGCSDDLCCGFTGQGPNGTAPTGGGGLYCNSIGCPNGFTPIDDAQTTVCGADPCDPAQCCEAFCSYHPCSNGLIPIEDAQTTLCPDSGCSDDLCCV